MDIYKYNIGIMFRIFKLKSSKAKHLLKIIKNSNLNSIIILKWVFFRKCLKLVQKTEK